MRRIRPEDILHMKWVSNPQMSPNGRKVLFTIKQATGPESYSSHIYLAQGGEVVQFTHGAGQDTCPRWSPSGDSVAFLSTRGSGRNQIHVIQASGGEARQVTFRKEGAGEPVWSPCGCKIAFCAREAPSAEEPWYGSEVRVITNLGYRRNGVGFVSKERRQVFILDIVTGSIQQLTTGPYDCNDPVWSPDGKKIAFISARSKGNEFTSVNDIHIVSVDSCDGDLTKLTSGNMVFSNLAWSPDGTCLACYGHDDSKKGATLNSVCKISVDSGTVTYLARDVEMTVGGKTVSDLQASDLGPIWSDDSLYIYFSAVERGRNHVYKVCTKTQRVTGITTGDCVISSFSKAANSPCLAVTLTNPLLIGDVFVLAPENGFSNKPWNAFKKVCSSDPYVLKTDLPLTIRRLTYANDSLLSEVWLSQPEEFETASTDGTRIHGWIMRPVGFRENAMYPALLQIHGGPHSSYGFAFSHEFQYLVSQGYGLFYANPRGSIGYGQKFAAGTHHDWGGGDFNDLMAVVDEVTMNPWIDSSRMGVLGGSYGGFMTNWIVTHTSRFKAAVTMRSSCNRTSHFGCGDSGYLRGDFEYKGAPWENPGFYVERSPLFHVEKVRTPLMIIHGEEDFRSPIGQAEEMFTAMKKTGNDTVMVRFPGENHDLSRTGRPKNRILRLKFIASWLNRYLSPVDDAYISAPGEDRQPAFEFE